jgi:prephenate dehydrogenase
MQYFILLPNDSEKDCYTDNNLLGEASFGKFYVGSGFRAFMKIVNNEPELLTKIVIKTDRSESLTVEEFLTRIQPLKVLING